jgi:hypothetical protein
MINRNQRTQRIQEKRNCNQTHKTDMRKLVSAKKISRPLKAKMTKSLDYGFISGGIGDVIAVESFLSTEHRNRLKTIFYATKKQQEIEQLFKSLTNYPNLEEHLSVWDDFSQFWCFYSLQDYLNKSRHIQPLKTQARVATDLSILSVFENIKSGLYQYNHSSFLQQELTNIVHLNLPSNYVVVLPYSTDKRIKKRDFTEEDWNQILKTLKDSQIKGVVINSENEEIPESDLLINLSQKTTLTEAIEVLKMAKGYFGIDSWMSVLAAKLFDIPNLQIKSQNEHCYNNSAFYFAPKTNFEFMVKQIIAPSLPLIFY